MLQTVTTLGLTTRVMILRTTLTPSIEMRTGVAAWEYRDEDGSGSYVDLAENGFVKHQDVSGR